MVSSAPCRFLFAVREALRYETLSELRAGLPWYSALILQALVGVLLELEGQTRVLWLELGDALPTCFCEINIWVNSLIVCIDRHLIKSETLRPEKVISRFNK